MIAANIYKKATAVESIVELNLGRLCIPLKGSAYTSKGLLTSSCNVGIPNSNQPPNTNRRYVIDGTMSSASVLYIFRSMPNACDSHEFRFKGASCGMST